MECANAQSEIITTSGRVKLNGFGAESGDAGYWITDILTSIRLYDSEGAWRLFDNGANSGIIMEYLPNRTDAFNYVYQGDTFLAIGIGTDFFSGSDPYTSDRFTAMFMLIKLAWEIKNSSMSAVNRSSSSEPQALAAINRIGNSGGWRQIYAGPAYTFSNDPLDRDRAYRLIFSADKLSYEKQFVSFHSMPVPAMGDHRYWIYDTDPAYATDPWWTNLSACKTEGVVTEKTETYVLPAGAAVPANPAANHAAYVMTGGTSYALDPSNHWRTYAEQTSTWNGSVWVTNMYAYAYSGGSLLQEISGTQNSWRYADPYVRYATEKTYASGLTEKFSWSADFRNCAGTTWRGTAFLYTKDYSATTPGTPGTVLHVTNGVGDKDVVVGNTKVDYDNRGRKTRIQTVSGAEAGRIIIYDYTPGNETMTITYEPSSAFKYTKLAPSGADYGRVLEAKYGDTVFYGGSYTVKTTNPADIYLYSQDYVYSPSSRRWTPVKPVYTSTASGTGTYGYLDGSKMVEYYTGPQTGTKTWLDPQGRKVREEYLNGQVAIWSWPAGGGYVLTYYTVSGGIYRKSSVQETGTSPKYSVCTWTDPSHFTMDTYINSVLLYSREFAIDAAGKEKLLWANGYTQGVYRGNISVVFDAQGRKIREIVMSGAGKGRSTSYDVTTGARTVTYEAAEAVYAKVVSVKYLGEAAERTMLVQYKPGAFYGRSATFTWQDAAHCTVVSRESNGTVYNTASYDIVGSTWRVLREEFPAQKLRYEYAWASPTDTTSGTLRRYDNGVLVYTGAYTAAVWRSRIVITTNDGRYTIFRTTDKVSLGSFLK
jgi:hypothetical protein